MHPAGNYVLRVRVQQLTLMGMGPLSRPDQRQSFFGLDLQIIVCEMS